MTAAVFTAAGDGVFSVSGPVTFETVTELWRASHGKFDRSGAVRIDLGGITEIDSAGLSLLLEWVRWARRQAGNVSFEHPPPKLLALARIGDVDQLLSIAPVAATRG